MLLVGQSFFAYADEHISKAAPNAKAYIISPTNGAVVNQEFKVVFGLHNMGGCTGRHRKKVYRTPSFAD